MTETWLSQEAYDRLKAEHLHLTTVGREEASKAIEIARQHGDLRENAEYDSAKEEQGKMESRIKQLVELLREAKIGQPTETDVVAQGLVVTLDIDGDQEQFLVGNREDSHETFEILSAASPIGRAIEGRKVGDEAVAQLPNGGSLKVKVKAIETL